MKITKVLAGMYKTEDDRYIIKEEWREVPVINNQGFSNLEEWKYVLKWVVYIKGTNEIQIFDLLKEAKEWIQEQYNKNQ